MKPNFVIIAGLVTLYGCHKDPLYCPGAPLDNCDLIDASVIPDEGMSGCTSNDQCTAPTAVCNLPVGTCVQCTSAESSACTGTSPVCGGDDTCHGCSAHSDCTSDACLPDGSCGTDSNVAYVDPGGTDNTTCSKAMPCTKVAKALATSRPYVKFHGTTSELVTVTGQDVTLLADVGAKLTPPSAGSVLTVGTTSHVAAFDLAFDGSNANGANPVVYVLAGASGTLSLRRVTISASGGLGLLTSASGATVTVTQSTISANTAGGLSISGGSFVILNNMFFANGNSSSLVGGIAIGTTQSASNRLDFNSFNKNSTQDGIGTAIQCIAGTFTARNNAMSGNGTLSNTNQTGGTCAHAYSIATPGTLPTGTGNLAVDPKFANTTTGDLHLQDGSPAIDAADPTSDLSGPAAIDFDGDHRPTGPHADIGADERH